MANYYLDMGPPPEDPIMAGLKAVAGGAQSLKNFKAQPKKPAPLQGGDSGLTPEDPDYWKGRLRQDMQQDQLIQQDQTPLPMGAQTQGAMYA